jgi:protein-S-isoprenylcysteine O-methyltransferase Ste14
MTRRAKLPLVLSVVLLLGVAALGWLKLRAWQGSAQAVGATACAIYLCWILWEGRIAVRDSRQNTVTADRWTAEFYALSQGATALTALLFASHWPVPAEICMAAGALTFLGGVILRMSAIRELGRFYSHRVQVLDSHPIVRTGPYHWLRHPAYAAMLLAHLGFVLLFFNWVSAAILCGALLPAIVHRIRVEELTLSKISGYPEYCLHRARLIPLVW